MKLKIFSIVLTAIIIICCISVYAQQAPVEPVAPETSIVPAQAIAKVPTRNFQHYGFQPITKGMYGYVPFQNGDTVYNNKMKQLREQMNKLQKQMSELSREQSKKTNEVIQEKMLTVRKNMNKNFDSTFNKKFNMNFNFKDLKPRIVTEDNLDKEIKSGNVKEKEKNYSKTYPADRNDKLQIDNRFGKVTVNTWNKNEFKVDVQIKAYAAEDKEAQKLLDQTNISDSKNNDLVTFKTTIGNFNDNNAAFWITTAGKKTSVHKVVINYTVYMPVKSAADITNKYGAIILPDLDGKLNINGSFGVLVAKTLTNSDNVINVKYGSANIAGLTGSDLHVSFGSLDLEKADKVNAVIDYGPAKIGTLTTSGTFNVRFGGLEIQDVNKNLRSLTVNSSYGPVKLGSVADTNADFDVTVNMGDFLYGNATNITSKSPDNQRGYTPTKNYKGHLGKGNADKMITIKSRFSTVKFD